MERQPTLLSAKQNLTGFHLKWIGIILMVMDHLHQMFILQGVPVWFNWLGRPVAPIFIFLCAEGFFYTHSKKRYMLQLFIGYWGMAIISLVLTKALPLEEIPLTNNIFGTLLVSTLYMQLVDMLRKGSGASVGKKILYILGMIGMIAMNVLPLLLQGYLPWQLIVGLLLFIPSPISVEGGIFLVVLAVLFYIFRDHRLLQILGLILVSVFTFFTMEGMQWLMVFAAIPILFYGGQRGKGSKYFFYIFYPAHVYLFYIIAFCLMYFGV
ncbi:MAG: conjugal transfer protein TraX [Clostridiales Family XIII bacterium]|nr:conjugal transfer protein TraX [Clostridiales Family XIII bacterium]